MVTRPRKARRAVALVDAIVAVIILGVSLSVLLSLTGQAITSQRVGEENQNAAMLADEQLNLVLTRGPDEYAKTYPVEGECDAPFEAFRFKLQIDGQGDAAPYKVSCTIAWDAGGREKAVTVHTLIAPRTLINQIDRQPVDPVERNL